MDVVLKLSADGQESQTGQRLLVLAKVELISGKLLTQEFVEWQIVIERTNHVVAIGEGIRTVGTGVASHVQPMSAPALAVMR